MHGSVVAPAHLARLARRRWMWLFLLGIVAAVTVWDARRPPARAVAPDDPPILCALPDGGPPAPPEAPGPSPAQPGPDTWTALETCLARGVNFGRPGPAPVTVTQIRGWIAEGDPVWFEGGRWWLPMSGEGMRDMPSGLYVSVPVDGGACGGAIVN